MGMKFRVIDGWAVMPPQFQRDRRQKFATRRSGYIAPFGAPVLPEGVDEQPQRIILVVNVIQHLRR
jgi:hypothetical protein